MSRSAVRAFVALGSNLDDPADQLRRAFAALAGLQASTLLAMSPVYRSRPLGPPGQPDYLNAVAALETRLEPLDLLDSLQQTERRHGRTRGERWGPRTLDLDLLLYGERRIDSARLQVPHPEMHRRAFVLVPLAQIAPDLVVPGIGALAGLLEELDPADLQALEAQP
jgi:2-amino-4-hydroxy-6-hydroxymethyldihydropteridine diphosphokinase